MGIISNIIESNRQCDQRIAEIEKTSREEIAKINAHYAAKEKKLKEHHKEMMKKLDDPNLTIDELVQMYYEAGNNK